MNDFNTNTSDTFSVASRTEASDIQPELLTPPAALSPLLPSEVNRPQNRPEGAFKMWLVAHGYMISEDVDFENTSHPFFATRLSDRATMMLKPETNPYEHKRNWHEQLIASDLQDSKSPPYQVLHQFERIDIPDQMLKNHCVPIFDVLEIPKNGLEAIYPNGIKWEGKRVWVMPCLREFDYDAKSNEERNACGENYARYWPFGSGMEVGGFETVGEAVAFFWQVLEGLQYLHYGLRIVLRQIKPSSVMMGHTEYLPLPMPESRRFPPFQQPFTGHPQAAPYSAGPKTYTRTQRPPTYFLCDYSQARVTEPWGMNRWYSLDEWHAYGCTNKFSEPPRIASEPNVGGYVDVHPANDLWYLGNLFDTKFLQRYKGLEFMEPLVHKMMRAGPRPSTRLTVQEFLTLKDSLGSIKLRSRLVERNESPGLKAKRNMVWFLRTMEYVMKKMEAVPMPKYHGVVDGPNGGGNGSTSDDDDRHE